MGEKPRRRVRPVVTDDAHGGAADPANGLPEPSDLIRDERAGGIGRMEACAPKDFVGHPIPDAREMLLHEEHGLEWSAAAALEETREALQSEFVRKNAGCER